MKDLIESEKNSEEIISDVTEKKSELNFTIDDVEKELKRKLDSDRFVVKRYGNSIGYDEPGLYVKPNKPDRRQSGLRSISFGPDGKVEFSGGKGTGTMDLQKEFDSNASLKNVVDYIIKRSEKRLYPFS